MFLLCIILSLAVVGSRVLFLKSAIAFLSILWHWASVRGVILCVYSSFGMITLLYRYLNCAIVAFFPFVTATKSFTISVSLLTLFFLQKSALIHTPKNLTSCLFGTARTIMFSAPNVRKRSSSGILGLMISISDFAPFILMSFRRKNSFDMSIVFCAWFLFLASHIVSSA